MTSTHPPLRPFDRLDGETLEMRPIVPLSDWVIFGASMAVGAIFLARSAHRIAPVGIASFALMMGLLVLIHGCRRRVCRVVVTPTTIRIRGWWAWREIPREIIAGHRITFLGDTYLYDHDGRCLVKFGVNFDGFETWLGRRFPHLSRAPRRKKRQRQRQRKGESESQRPRQRESESQRLAALPTLNPPPPQTDHAKSVSLDPSRASNAKPSAPAASSDSTFHGADDLDGVGDDADADADCSRGERVDARDGGGRVGGG